MSAHSTNQGRLKSSPLHLHTRTHTHTHTTHKHTHPWSDQAPPRTDTVWSCARTSLTTVLGERQPSASQGENFDENPLPSNPLRVTLYSRRRSSSQIYCRTRFSAAVSPPSKGSTAFGSRSGAVPSPSSSVAGKTAVVPAAVSGAPSWVAPVGTGRKGLGGGNGGFILHAYFDSTDLRNCMA